jgi:hypothetical protein
MLRALLLLLLAAACRTVPGTSSPSQREAGAPAPGEQPTAAQACALTACRPPRTVTLVLDGEREMRQELPPFPYVYQEVVYVVPGDDFRITGEVKGDRLVGLRVVREGEQVPLSLRIRFEQEVESPSTQRMVLALDSGLPRALAYRVSMLQAEVPGFQPTRGCPVPAGKSAYESWPQALRTLVLEDLRFLEPGERAGGAAPDCE